MRAEAWPSTSSKCGLIRMTEAHATGDFAELVCSNSLRSNLLTAPAGLLKEEMRRLSSIVIGVAENNRVPAGSALAVDRERFARSLTQVVQALPNVRVHREEAKEIPSGMVILASGPLTSPALSQRLAISLGGRTSLFLRRDFSHRHRGVGGSERGLQRIAL